MPFKDQSPCGWGKFPFPPSPTALATSQGLCGEYAGVAPTGSASGSSMRASAPPATALWQAAASAAAALHTAALSREQIISTVPLGHPCDFPVHNQPASGYDRPVLCHGRITSKCQEESAARGFTCRRGRACTELVRQEKAGVVRCALGPNGMKAAMSAASTSLGRLVAGTPSDRAASFTLMLSRGQPSRLCSL
jgi:hypothetical protein